MLSHSDTTELDVRTSDTIAALARGYTGPDRRVGSRPVSPFQSDRLSRAVDLLVASFALLLFAPLMGFIALAVWCSGGSILFGHRRLGRHGKTFTCYKFRTMYANGDQLLAELLRTDPAARVEWERDHKLRRDPRVSVIGSFLRKTSLDELPQLFNVIAGTMSIVGPRPIVQAEAQRYGRYFSTYCQVRPGITGLWQVSGRSSTSYRRRVACDVAYVRSKAAITDLQIMARTIPAICFARGAY